MIESAKIVTGFDDFACCGADAISVKHQYDIVMSESVFQYFESLEYAESVLRKMIEKSTRLTYLGEIHNAEYEQELMEMRKRTIVDYEQIYQGLSKLFFEKNGLIRLQKNMGKK